jgi:hypothetical protein
VLGLAWGGRTATQLRVSIERLKTTSFRTTVTDEDSGADQPSQSNVQPPSRCCPRSGASRSVSICVSVKSARLRAPGLGESVSGVSRSSSVPPATRIEPSGSMRVRRRSMAATARGSSGTASRNESEYFTRYASSSSGRATVGEHHSVARASHGSPPISKSAAASPNVSCEREVRSRARA